ncbi:hypothetical protein KAJ27_06645 [bacterium]|nr:hypothetical protein [bacterium]
MLSKGRNWLIFQEQVVNDIVRRVTQLQKPQRLIDEARNLLDVREHIERWFVLQLELGVLPAANIQDTND